MIVTCEGCETNFHLDERQIRPTGSKVRCSKCRHIFIAYPPAPAAEPEEPLMLSDEVPTPVDARAALGQGEIDSKLDELFREDGFEEDTTASTDVPEADLPDLQGFLTENAPVAEAFTSEKLGDDVELDLDLGISLEDDQAGEGSSGNEASTVADVPASEGSEEAEIDFSLDLEPVEEPASMEDLPSLDELELNLEELDGLGEEAQPVAAPTASPADSEGAEPELDLDLGSLDLEAGDKQDTASKELDLETLFQETSSGAGEAPGPAEGLLDGMLLDIEPASDEKEPAAVGIAASEGAEPELDLDLGSLDVEGGDSQDAASKELDLETLFHETSPGALEAPGPAEGLLDEIRLDLEPASDEKEPAAADARSENDDELDLSDLEAMLEGEGPSEARMPGGEEGVDLELDLDSEPVSEAKASGEMEELDLDAIAAELEGSTAPADLSSGLEAAEGLEPEIEAGSLPAQAAESATDELDFTDITAILEKEEPPPGALEAEEPAKDHALLFDEEPEAVSPTTQPEVSEAQEDLMLDIDRFLDDGEEKAAEAAETTSEAIGEMDLDLVDESTPGRADDMEIEIEPVRDEMDAEAAVPASAAAAAAFSQAGEADTEYVSEEKFTDRGLTGATDILETEDAVDLAPETALQPRRSGARKILMTALALLVLAIAALVIPRGLGIHIPYLSDLGSEIPIIGKIFESEPEDTAGNLKMSPMAASVAADFIQNNQAGRLCVIKGTVKNNYDHPRNFIQVTGKLYTKDKQMAKSLTGYAGTVLSKEELAGLDLATIKSRLKSKNGTDNSNVGVNPGATVPFMLVIDQLPNDLDEYSVEVAGSSK